MKGGGAKTVSNSRRFYSSPHVSFYSSARFIELADLLLVRVAIAKVFSRTLHSNAVPFLRVCSEVPPQSEVERRRKGGLTMPEGLFISAAGDEKIKWKMQNLRVNVLKARQLINRKI